MNRRFALLLVSATVIAIVATPRAHDKWPAPRMLTETGGNHIELAAKYEAMSRAEAQRIAEHEQMLAQYRERLYVNDEITPRRMFRGMEKRCGDLIAAAKELQANYDEQVRFHRFRASEPERRR